MLPVDWLISTSHDTFASSFYGERCYGNNLVNTHVYTPANRQQESSETEMGVLLLTDVLPFLQHQSSDQHVRSYRPAFG